MSDQTPTEHEADLQIAERALDRVGHDFEQGLRVAGPADARLAILERRISSQQRVIAMLGAVVMILVIGVVAASVLFVDRFEALAKGKLDWQVLSAGLGVDVERSDRDLELQARLAELSAVSLESGAWQTRLERQGVDPATFLDELVSIAGEAEDLRRLAAAKPALLELSDRAATLGRLSGAATDVLSLASRRDALDRLIASSDRLQALGDDAGELARLVELRDRLELLATSSEQIDALASQSEALAALAQQAGSLAELGRATDAIFSGLERTTILEDRFEVDQGRLEAFARDLRSLDAELGPLADLASRSRDLIELAEASAAIDAGLGDARRAASYVDSRGLALDRLVGQQQALTDLAVRHRSLLRLAEAAPALEALAAESEALVELAEAANRLLSQRPVTLPNGG